MLKTIDFSWVFFACWFLVFLSCFYFFFFYSCTATTTGITTTITSNRVNEGEGTLETSYKLWSSEFRSFGRRKEWVAPKFVLLLALSLGSTYTHTHTHKVWLRYKIYTKWCNPTYTCFPCTWVLRLTSRLCIPMCFWAWSHVMNYPCNNFRRRRRRRE
jgi:hypothetical protein